MPWMISAGLLVVNILQFAKGQSDQSPALRLVGSGTEVREGRIFPPTAGRSYWYVQNTGQGTAHNIFVHVPHADGVKQLSIPELSSGDIGWLKDWPSNNTYMEYMQGTAGKCPVTVTVAYCNSRMRKREKKIVLPGDSYGHLSLESQLDRVVGERPPLKEW